MIHELLHFFTFLVLITSTFVDASDVFFLSLNVSLIRYLFRICGFQGTYLFSDWFHQPFKTKTLFDLKSLVKPVYFISTALLFGLPCFCGWRFYLISSFLCFFWGFWQPPTLPHRLQCSTLGRPGLNLRVRDGNGCVPWPHRHQKYSSYSILLITQQ